MRKLSFALAILFYTISFQAFAQFTDNFSDGDFTKNPVWTGNTASFVINKDLQLQSNSQINNDAFYLSTINTLAKNAEWDFYVRIDFNPSSKNFVDVYLISAKENLLSAANTGYFVRIGNTDDQVALYIKKADGKIQKIIDGVHGLLNKNKSEIRIRVTRDNNFQWTLYRQLAGTDADFIKEGTADDNTFQSSGYFGILINQSTASFFNKHYFDNFSVQSIADNSYPRLIKIIPKNHQDLDLVFDKPIERNSAAIVSNYDLDLSAANPSVATLDPDDSTLIHLHFTNLFPENQITVLTVKNLRGKAGNVLPEQSLAFSYNHSMAYEIVIDEIMADPVPSRGLPEEEWLEIKNTSNYIINLQGWRILKNNKFSAPLPDYPLQPDSFLLLCKTTASNALTPLAKVIGISNFPTLANNSDIISLVANDNQTVHAVSYSSKWYQNPVKAKGGWTLEMIDTKNPCEGIKNWKACIDISGGTPGRKNSIDGINPETDPPVLLRTFTIDGKKVMLVFDKAIDSLSASNIHNYLLSDGLSIDSVIVSGPFSNLIELKIAGTFEAGKIYTVTASGVSGCTGISEYKNISKFGLPERCDSNDLVINELLYRPKPGSETYLEIYNRSNKVIDLKNIYLGKRNDLNEISEIYTVTKNNFQLLPSSYIVLTKDSSKVLSQYHSNNKNGFIELSNFPSFGKDSGKVLLLNETGLPIDELDYFDRWQFQLLSNTEGVSLERINFNEPATEDNFHSASSTAGFGTPAELNSMFMNVKKSNDQFDVTPEIFSPDNDGHDDYATISYAFKNPGLLATINIFDAEGRLIRNLISNALCGRSGTFRWDGLGQQGQQLKMGIYIILFTSLDTSNGSKKQFKKAVVLARK